MDPVLRRVGHGGLLVAAVLLVASVTYLPHLDSQDLRRADRVEEGLAGLAQTYFRWWTGTHDDYEYPLHVDENHHWAFMAQLQRDETLRFNHPYSGEPPTGLFGLKGSTHEKGFHLAVAQFQLVTDIPWPVVFRFLPAVWMGGVAWGVWSFLRPWKGAPLAAALVALVPTSDRFIGPAFLVPIGLGLAWIPIAGLLANESFNARRSSALLVLVVSWAFFIHFIAGLAAAAAAASTIPWSRHRRRAGVLLVVAVLPVAWLSTTFADELGSEATKYNLIPVDRAVFDQIGIGFLLLSALGLLAFLYYPPREHRAVLLSFGFLAAVTFAMIGINLAFRLENYFLYERWHQPFALFATVPAAYGILLLGRNVPRGARFLRHKGFWGTVTAVGLAFITLNQGIDGHLREPYYHIMDDQSWAAAAWAGDNLHERYTTFLSDPWQAPVINAMTGRHPISVLYPGTPPTRADVYLGFLAGGYGDGPYLVRNDITWTLSLVPVTAPEFEPLGPMVFGLRSPYIEEYNTALKG